VTPEDQTEPGRSRDARCRQRPAQGHTTFLLGREVSSGPIRNREVFERSTDYFGQPIAEIRAMASPTGSDGPGLNGVSIGPTTGASRSKRPSAMSTWPCRRVRGCVRALRRFGLLLVEKDLDRSRLKPTRRWISIRITPRRTTRAESQHLWRPAPRRCSHIEQASGSIALSKLYIHFSARLILSPANRNGLGAVQGA